MNIKKTFFGSSRGNILVPVVVAMSAALVAMLALSELIMKTQLAGNTVQRNFEADVGISEMRETVRDNPTCLDSFGGFDPNVNRIVPNIRTGATIHYAPGTPIVTGVNTVSRIEQLAANPPIPANGRGFIDIRVTFDLPGRALGSQFISRRFRVLAISTAGTISSCNASPYQPFTDCIDLSQAFPNHRSVFSPTCPAGYTVTGGGIWDSDYSNDDQGTIVSGNRWHCRNDDRSAMRCAVICCR